MQAANTLTRYGLSVRVFDDRSDVRPAGFADGIQPRTVEMLRHMGLAHEIYNQEGGPGKVVEIHFWVY